MSSIHLAAKGWICARWELDGKSPAGYHGYLTEEDCAGGQEAARQAAPDTGATVDDVSSADERPTALQAVDSQAVAGDAVHPGSDPGKGLIDQGVDAPGAAGEQAEGPEPEQGLAPREPASGGSNAHGHPDPAAPDRGLRVRGGPELRVRLTPDGAAAAAAAQKPAGPDPWLLFNDEAVSASSADEARALYGGRVAPCLLYFTQARCAAVQTPFPSVIQRLHWPFILQSFTRA